MERIVIRHLNGSKANQVEEFPLEDFKELKIGRNPDSGVKYDPSQDDLVSRAHAVIQQDTADTTKFTITDLNSTNGTYVNKRRISGTVRIMPGDVIQLGPGGPEFQFDVEPRPADILGPTRVAEASVVEPPPDTPLPTRDGQVRTPPPHSGSPSGPTYLPVGKGTVERLIAQSKNDVCKYLVNGAAALLGIMVLVMGILLYKDSTTKQAIAKTRMELAETKEHAAKTDQLVAPLKEVMPPAEIAKAYGPATVYIESGWKLISTPTGKQIYHRYVSVKKGQELLPAYLLLDDNVVEPWLISDDENGTNDPIGSMGVGGSGFVVTENGFILTNRHVAAPWETRYWSGGLPPLPGLLFPVGQNGEVRFTEGRRISAETEVKALLNWVPAKSKLLGSKPVSGKLIEGRHDYFDVTFPKNKLRIPARLVRVSDTADVALVKIDVPQSSTKVQMHNNYDSVNAGGAITVLGYPAVSPSILVKVKSQDPMSPQGYWTVVPDPTVTTGGIGRVIRGEATPGGGSTDDYLSSMGDVYQLTINATGPGNSGGPVFDDRGRVIGIFAYIRYDQAGTKISFAIPIKYGMELMGLTTVMR